MAQTTARSAISGLRGRRTVRPFLGLIDAVIVDVPADVPFEGAVDVEAATAAWVWMARDVAPDLANVHAEGEEAEAALAANLPALITRAKTAIAATQGNGEALRRLRTQLGGEEAWQRLPVVLNALRCRTLIEKAEDFGRAANAIADDAALTQALEALPVQEPAVAALLMHAAAGQVAAPSRLVLAAIRITGEASEGALQQHGFGPLIEALFSQAQNQIPPLIQGGVFADVDLVCRAMHRFHRLQRAVLGYVELERGSRWSNVSALLTRAMSDQLEPKLRDILPDMNNALRRRDGVDHVDGDLILGALNGMYLMATVRDCRDSLAVNAAFDHVWSQTGQALEIHLERQFEQLRRTPADAVIRERLEATLKMTEIRFGAEYAETMRRAKDVAERRS
jgi:hypothetical protein